MAAEARTLEETTLAVLGAHKETIEFEFQEKVRRLSLNGCKVAEPWFYNGYSQLVAMKQLLPTYAHRLDPEFLFEVEQAVAAFQEDGGILDLSKNKRLFVKRVLQWPHWPSYHPWVSYTNENVLGYLKQMESAKHEIKVHQNKLYLFYNHPRQEKVFDRVLELMESETKGDPMEEQMHITLINSDQFVHLMGFQAAVDACCATVVDDLQITELKTTFSEDYPPYLACVVGIVTSQKLSAALEELFQNLPSPRCVLKSEFHVTVWRRARLPLEL